MLIVSFPQYGGWSLMLTVSFPQYGGRSLRLIVSFSQCGGNGVCGIGTILDKALLTNSRN